MDLLFFNLHKLESIRAIHGLMTQHITLIIAISEAD